jgi:hypothetical protein
VNGSFDHGQDDDDHDSEGDSEEQPEEDDDAAPGEGDEDYVSVGSPDNAGSADDGTDEHERGEQDAVDGPIDFTSTKASSEQSANRKRDSSKAASSDEYFMPFKKLGLDMSSSAEIDVPSASPPQQQPQPPSAATNNRKKRNGLQSFSIDDILSHRTAEMQRQKQQLEADAVSAIVRPWDIASKTTSASVVSAGAEKRRASAAGDSPLDALFQMASKTFEGLKAKSGRRPYFYFSTEFKWFVHSLSQTTRKTMG